MTKVIVRVHPVHLMNADWTPGGRQPWNQASRLGLWHTHTRLTALFPGLPRWAGTRKVKPISILLEQETVSGSGISWAIGKSAPRSRQTTTPAPHRSVFTGRMPFLPPNQQRQSTEGKNLTWKTWAASLPKIGSYHPHPPSQLLLLLSP